MSAIISVHLKWYKQCEEYVPLCLRQTALSNPNHECILLTASTDLKSYFTANVQLPSNARIEVLSEESIAQKIDKLETIFYHDKINPKWFDLFSIARHLIVQDFVISDSNTSKLSSFITTDSDIAHFYNYSKQLASVASEEVLTGSPLMSYFATWGKEAFETYSDFYLMTEYFEFAKSRPRCSDMHLLWWHIKEKTDIKIIQPAFKDFGIPLDTLRDFIYIGGLWIDSEVADDKTNQLLVDYPGGDWRDFEYLKKYRSSSFWDSMLIRSKVNEVTKLSIKRASLLTSMTKLNAIKKTEANHNAKFFSNFGGLAGKRSWDSILASPDSELINVPYIHFQGAGKQLAPFFEAYLQ